MRVMAAAQGLYTYPDMVVTYDDPKFEDDHVDTLLNPTLIIEVLSPSTERYDRGDKFRHYRQIKSLQEYVLIAQTRPSVERFTRQTDNQWLLHEVSGLDATINLSSINCTLNLTELYERVKF